MSQQDGKYDGYRSPLEGRYASKEMQHIWSEKHRFGLWREIWLAAASAQHEVGLPVTKEQVEELRANLEISDADIDRAKEIEGEIRHDVMSHVHAWGEQCPNAKGIIHLGMTSQDVNDNAELWQIGGGLEWVEEKLDRLMLAIGNFADQWKSTPTLAFTHYQPAQPTTVGRRASQWAYDLSLCKQRIDGHCIFPSLRGLRGATGTQASYLNLLDNDADAVDRLEFKFIAAIQDAQDGIIDVTWEREQPSTDINPILGETPVGENFMHDRFTLTGQTYPRVYDTFLIADLASIACVLHKMATDIRLLSNRKELDEPFEDKQIGSSAMPYKRNPMRCERVCGLSRFVMNLVGNAYETAATQWLERTLDDSANRRLVLPEAFLALDGCLDIMRNVISGLVVHEKTIEKNLMAELPFMASENLMMEAVKLGRDRQEVHEAIRVHAQEAGRRVKEEGADNDLIERLRTEPLLEGVDLDGAMDPMKYVGLAVEQTERFIEQVIEPLREQYGDDSANEVELKV